MTHRDRFLVAMRYQPVGYNVLYDDWHAAWYGDPQQRFIYWSQLHPTAAQATAKGWGTDTSSVSDVIDITGGLGTFQKRGSALAWHLFDSAAGVDVGVD